MIKINTSGDYVQLIYVDAVTESVQQELKSDTDAFECSYDSDGKLYMQFGLMRFENPDPTDFTINGSAVTDAADFISKLNALFTGGGGGTTAYKIYSALLSQSATDAPTASILENTIGDIVWTRDSLGFYFGTLTGAFTLGKTVCPPFSDPETLLGLFQSTPFDYGWNISAPFSADKVTISFYQSSDGSSVEWSSLALTPLFIEIRVYN